MDSLNDSSNETAFKTKDSINSENSMKNKGLIEKSECETPLENLEQAFQTILEAHKILIFIHIYM